MDRNPLRFDRDSFQAWKAHPLTKPLLAYFRDNRDRLAEQWAAGEAMSPQQQCKALLMGELSDLEWADVASFYDIPTEEDGAE